MNETAIEVEIRKQPQKLKPKKICVLKKLDLETAKLLDQLKERANKKPYGRKIRDTEIVALALKQLTAELLVDLQESTYSARDRLEIAHEKYQKTSGKISLDDFIERLMRGEVKLNNEIK